MKISPELKRRSRALVLAVILFSVFYTILLVPTMIGVARYHQREAVDCLVGIATAEVSNYALYERWSDSFEQIGWAPYGPARYAYFITPFKSVGRPLEDFNLILPIKFDLMGTPPPGVTKDGFVAVAIGYAGLSDDPDVWWIDQNRTLIHAKDGTGYWTLFFYLIKKLCFFPKWFDVWE